MNRKNTNIVITNNESYKTKLVVNCAGLYSDKVASMTEDRLNIRIIPFRGEYYEIRKERHNLVKNLIYPVPDLSFPFLGVHFTRMIQGGVEAGPNAVLAFKREGYKKTSFSVKDTLETFTYGGFLRLIRPYWKMGLGEMARSLSKEAFVKALQRLIPELRSDDVFPGGAGVRADGEPRGRLRRRRQRHAEDHGEGARGAPLRRRRERQALRR